MSVTPSPHQASASSVPAPAVPGDLRHVCQGLEHSWAQRSAGQLSCGQVSCQETGLFPESCRDFPFWDPAELAGWVGVAVSRCRAGGSGRTPSRPCGWKGDARMGAWELAGPTLPGADPGSPHPIPSCPIPSLGLTGQGEKGSQPRSPLPPRQPVRRAASAPTAPMCVGVGMGRPVTL